MKRKSLLFALLLALFMPWAANAQNRTVVTIGDGTSTQRYPLPGYYGYQYDVYIYTPTAAPALDADCDISSIAFNVTTNNTDGESTMEIWVKDVDADYALVYSTTFADYTADAELVYENDDFTSTTGWNTLAFTRDFSHQGGKALLVAVRGTGCGTTACSRQCTYTSVSNTTWYKHQDNSDPGTNVTGSVGSSRANIQLDLTYTGAICLSPSGLAASNVTDNSATLSWNENGEATAWVLQYGTDSEFGTYTEENVHTTPSFGLTGLTALTTYYARVKPDCDADGSHWNMTTFTTTAYAEPVGDAWSDDFESGLNWELINGTCTNKWSLGIAANNGGSYGLYISNDNGTSNAYTVNSAAMVYATKLLNFTEGKYEFTYDWMANGESTYDYLRVALVPASVTLTAGTSTPSGFSTTGLPSGWIALDGGSKLNQVTAWQSKSLAINVTAGNYYLVMAWRDDTSGGTNPPAAVDNVNITRVACPYDVTGLDVSDITTSGATLTWTAGDAEQWQVAYSTNSTFEGATEVIVSAATYTMTDLTSATFYYVKVRAYCGGTDFGSWCPVVSFPTECETLDLSTVDFSENFDNCNADPNYTPTGRDLPICWNAINMGGGTYGLYPLVSSYSSSSYAHSGSNYLKFYSYYSSYSTDELYPQYALLPAMENMEGKQITLWAKGYNASSSIKIGMMTDPITAGASTFEMIAEQTLTTSYEEYSFILGSGDYVVIMIDAANSNRTSNGAYIDDITITDAPTCLKPTDLEATASSLSATFTWVSEVGSYEIAITTDDAADPADFIVGTATEATFTMNELALGDYYFWVRADCGNDGYSEWAGPVSFHIGYCVPTPSNVDGNGISNVTFGMGDNIVNNDTPKATYADYISEIGAVQAGVESTIAITYATGYTYGTIIWVDLDNSLSFEDSEIVYTGTSTNDNPTTLEATITIPATQTPGDYVMRIGGADSGFDSYINGTSTTAPSACYTGNWACFQDYTLRVLEAPSCLIPTGLAVNYTGGNTAEVTWEGTAETYNIMVGEEVTEGVTSPYTLQDLAMATTYSVKVQANCENDETSEWSNPVSFTTDLCMPENMCEISYSFTDQYDDSWNNAYINIVDATTQEVLFELTMPNVEGPYEGSFNVCDGRDIQFVWVSGSYPRECGYTFTHNGMIILEKATNSAAPDAGVVLTYTVYCHPFTKDILGYGSTENPGGYYLIASPINGNVNPGNVGGMTDNQFDLYRFNQENELEWENYKTEGFDLELGKGYLYANSENVTLTFVGTPVEDDNYMIPLSRVEGNDWAGWNLVGNPFADTAYILDINGETVSFYTLNAAGSKLEPVESFTSIAPMEGVFVYAEQEDEILNFTTEEPVKGSMLILNMSNENGYVDRVMVRFDESRQLPKFMLNENDTKMYISKDDQDYAVVRSNKSGSLPVSFEPAEDGFYSISVNTENVLMKHLHLIDHKERVDVDLLSTPNYRFEAKTNDKPNRFELVFKTGLSIFQELSSTKGGDTEGFGFFSKGNWIIDNEGEAILQVIDVQGRILSSEEISGCVSKRIEAAPGVYMLRLINSEDVKVQKIVVE